MIRDYAHAAALQHAWEGPQYDTTPSTETEQLFALKVIIEACGFDIPDVLFDCLEESINEYVANICHDNRVRDDEDGSIREQVECELKNGATLEWALLVVPDLAADVAAKELARKAKFATFRFIAGLFQQVPA